MIFSRTAGSEWSNKPQRRAISSHSVLTSKTDTFTRFWWPLMSFLHCCRSTTFVSFLYFFDNPHWYESQMSENEHLRSWLDGVWTSAAMLHACWESPLSSIHGTILPKMRKFSFCNPSLQKPKPYAKILFFYLNGNVSYFYLTKARQPDPCRERDICREVWYSFQLLEVGLLLRGYRADISLINKITVTRKILQYISIFIFI